MSADREALELSIFWGYFVSAERLELSTNGLKGHCSTIELRARGHEPLILVEDKADCILTCRSMTRQRNISSVPCV